MQAQRGLATPRVTQNTQPSWTKMRWAVAGRWSQRPSLALRLDRREQRALGDPNKARHVAPLARSTAIRYVAEALTAYEVRADCVGN